MDAAASGTLSPRAQAVALSRKGLSKGPSAAAVSSKKLSASAVGGVVTAGTGSRIVAASGRAHEPRFFPRSFWGSSQVAGEWLGGVVPVEPPRENSASELAKRDQESDRRAEVVPEVQGTCKQRDAHLHQQFNKPHGVEDPVHGAQHAPHADETDVHVLLPGIPPKADHDEHQEGPHNVQKASNAQTASKSLDGDYHKHPRTPFPGILGRRSNLQRGPRQW
mmetsp:Transcript_41708/g.96620  ORF Transcript_41708/g.96620 Transcript_41708/m.96620 type:complete len:221 (+) Transcript_41708:121-783(+)